MEKKAAVSIICTAYNHEKYIADALEGFLRQKTDFPFEAIVLDDASTDSTAQIIRRYEVQFPEIIKPIYFQENLYSRHISKVPYVKEKASGKYIALCEGDDYWIDENKLQKQFDYMEAHPECSWCIHNAYIVNVDKEVIGYISPCEKDRHFTADEVILGGGDFCSTNSILMRRELLMDRPAYTSIYNIDYVQQMYLASKGDTYCFADIMSAYRKGVPGSASSRLHTRDNLEHHLRLLNEVSSAFDQDTGLKYHESIDRLNTEREFQILHFRGKFRIFFDPKYKAYRRSLSFSEKLMALLGTAFNRVRVTFRKRSS